MKTAANEDGDEDKDEDSSIPAGLRPEAPLCCFVHPMMLPGPPEAELRFQQCLCFCQNYGQSVGPAPHPWIIISNNKLL